MKYIFPTLSMSSCAAQHFQNTSELCSYHLQHQFCRNESSKVDSDQQFKVASITKKVIQEEESYFLLRLPRDTEAYSNFMNCAATFSCGVSLILLRVFCASASIKVCSKSSAFRFEVFDKFLDHLQGNLNGISICCFWMQMMICTNVLSSPPTEASNKRGRNHFWWHSISDGIFKVRLLPSLG